ncbi:hypothetical protein [Aidingimonas halophila]|uniref:Uncharacterized protein n=1 Tax=Aidingimonas halophila TaxID=574349 RepID=A0A1H2Z8C7_9GAMM|nr:hypothetical protein [Aidingimonas halophila]GHC15544.1 hypothetical protein GCM10008094_00630 [Aidingimonas halophila]SDX13660.1 hypothetical protein SAMN05443545_10468 [Aidingimonas halophila]
MNWRDSGLVLVLAGALSLTGISQAQAQSAAKGPPDWPCVQRLVPELSWGSLWTGPSLDDLEQDWWDDDDVGQVVRFATDRKTDSDEALARVQEFVDSVADDEDRDERLTLLFAGLFDRIDSERSRVIERIRGAARGQVERLERVSDVVDRLEEARSSEESNQAEIQRLEKELQMEQRIFQKRQQALPSMCEKPYLLEEDLGRMVRIIRNAM